MRPFPLCEMILDARPATVLRNDSRIRLFGAHPFSKHNPPSERKFKKADSVVPDLRAVVDEPSLDVPAVHGSGPVVWLQLWTRRTPSE
jgi:hypothetical protein